MNWLHKLRLRFRALFHKEQLDAQMDDEIRSHIEMQTQENIEAGMKPEEARYAALRQFGRVESIKETCRDQRGLPALETFWQDIRYGARQLRKNPGFTAVAVVTLALGIGANTAIFSVVNAVLLRPLPFPSADQLVMIQSVHQREGGQGERWESAFDPPDFKEWREQSKTFTCLAAYRRGQTTLLTGGEPARIESADVTVDFFSLLGVAPLAGRTFSPEEHQAGGPPAAMLSERLWRSRFGANPAIVGQAITLDGKTVAVAGILPEHFSFPEDCDIWTSLVLDPRGNGFASALARLKPGVTLAQAQSEMDIIAQRIAQTLPATVPGQRVRLAPLQEQIVGGTRSLLFIFCGAVGFVLLIACANVTNLFLARATARRKEIQVRVALGAGRFRIARQLLSESVLLAFVGGILGLILAILGLDLLTALMPANLVPRIREIGLDFRVLGFNFALAILTGVACGLAPVWKASHTNANETLKESGRNQSGGLQQGFLQHALVAAEITVSIVLVIGAGLMLKSFARLQEVKLGFNPERTLTLNVSLPRENYPGPPQLKAFYREALDRVSALPGVSSAGFANAVPLASGGVRIYGNFAAEGRPESEASGTSKVAASPDYFRALGIPLLKGRFFTEADDDRAAGVAIINESLARHLWLKDDPLGKRVQIGFGGTTQPWLEIVGVVGDVRQDDLRVAPPVSIFIPYQQVAQTFFIETVTVVVRSTEEPRALAATIRKTIQSLDPKLPVFDIRTMEETVSLKLVHPRFNTWLLGAFSAMAMVLALVGIYGVMSYSVAQRTREIGIRVALGASGAEVLKLVVSQGMRAVLIGVLCGTGAALALTRFLTAQLYSVTPTDPATFTGVVVAFIAVALTACLIPASRATKVDPMVALRYE